MITWHLLGSRFAPHFQTCYYNLNWVCYNSVVDISVFLSSAACLCSQRSLLLLVVLLHCKIVVYTLQPFCRNICVPFRGQIQMITIWQTNNWVQSEPSSRCNLGPNTPLTSKTECDLAATKNTRWTLSYWLTRRRVKQTLSVMCLIFSWHNTQCVYLMHTHTYTQP